jgi:hypothetical protein
MATSLEDRGTGLPRAPRTDWTEAEVRALFARPLLELLYEAHGVHREHFHGTGVQISTLISIKTGACPEDCAYCPQSARYDTGVEPDRLLEVEAVVAAARAAKKAGASRFCMGAAYRNPRPHQLKAITAMVRKVKALGLETCATLGMLTAEQAGQLKAAGLDYYNHNLDTSERFYPEIISTRTYQDRLETGARARRRAPRLLRGHSRHGRKRGRPGRHAAHAGDPAKASRERPCQSAGTGGGHAAERYRTPPPPGPGALHRRGTNPHAGIPAASFRGPDRDVR